MISLCLLRNFFLETFENPEGGLAAAVAESLGLSGIVVDILAAMPLRGRASELCGPPCGSGSAARNYSSFILLSVCPQTSREALC